MEKDFIVNGSLIISFLFISGQLFKDNDLNPESSIKLRLMAGILFGLFGSCLMLFSIQISTIVIVDMRNIALIMAAVYGGWLAAFISALIIVAFRIGLFGINIASVTAGVVLLLLSTGCVFIHKLKFSFRSKFLMMVILSNLLSIIAFCILIDNKRMLFELSISFTIISTAIAFFSYFVFLYIQRSNELFRRYKEESKIDFLTGLFNNRQFEALFEQQKNNITNNREKLSVLAIDIDHFKSVNDTYGHPDGDKVLHHLGRILIDTTRSFDIVARSGGEEFAVMLLDCPNHRALEIAENIRSAVEMANFPISNGKEIHITISIGAATFPETTDDIHALFKQADNALYEAKHSGRNRVCSL